MDPAMAYEIQGLSYQRAMNEVMARGDSEIQMFYNGLTIFVTGGTGFIGKHLIEKLLRSCDIKEIFVLIRPKRGMAVEERLQEMLSDPVFDAVRKNKPYFNERIVAVEGDVAEIGLALNAKDRETITSEVDIIFHVAATIKFDEAIRFATITNVRGTREAIKLGKACHKLKSFIHVSTAYSHTTTRRVGGVLMEQFYECPVSPEVMIRLAEMDDDLELVTLTARLQKDWPNSYTFTKAIAEEVVRTESGDMRVTIVRPSIVLSTYIEPTPGWLDKSCMYGPSGIVMGVGMGIIRVLFVDNTQKLSFVPVDYVNNATIAAGWEAAVRPNQDINILNLSTTNCDVTFNNISKPMRNICRSIVPPLSFWYLYLLETNNRAFYWILTWLVHYIPAYIADAVIKVFGLKKPKELKSFVHIYKKYDKLAKIFEFFLTNGWNFDDSKLISMWDRMSSTDKQIYNFEMKTIDWDWYTLMWCLGVRKYILKDGLKNTDYGVRKQKWFKLANYTVAMLYLLIAWFIVRFIFNIFY